MGLYNIVFGESPAANLLLGILNRTRADFYRYRDCYLTEAGEIAVYTRGGGDNRECDCDKTEPHDMEVEIEGKYHRFDCVKVFHYINRNHPLYIRDEDDSYDSTYATFYFRMPDDLDRAELSRIEPELNRDEQWQQFLKGWKEMMGKKDEPG